MAWNQPGRGNQDPWKGKDPGNEVEAFVNKLKGMFGGGGGGRGGRAGSSQGNYLVVSDILAARADLVARGAAVSEIFHLEGSQYVGGLDPERKSYFTYAQLHDPDGNTWLLQEITTRLPGRGLSGLDVASLTDLLRDAEEHHGQYEATAPKHHWSDWYAAYMVARARGKTADEAATEAGLHMQRDVVHA